MEKTYDPVKGHILPEFPLHEARQIMTRADFIQSYDHNNIFTIDSRAMVRAGKLNLRDSYLPSPYSNELTPPIQRFGSNAKRLPRDLWG